MRDYEEEERCTKCNRKLTKLNIGEYGDECKICESNETITGGL